MIETKLLGALKDVLETIVADISVPTKSGPSKPPQIVSGYLPPKQSSADDDFPFVIVRAESGESNGETTLATVSLIIGCYTTEIDGYAYCLEVMQRIRAGLATLPGLTLAGRYQLRFPIRWENLPEQPYPQWQINMTTQWLFLTPQCTDY